MKNLKDNASCISVESAAAAIESGDTIWVGNTTGISNAFLEALAKRQNELKDVTILANKGNVPCDILDELKYRDSFHVLSFFKDALVQSYTSGEDKEKIKFLMSGTDTAIEMIGRQFGVNTIAVGVCPSDSDGLCNLGKSGDFITLAFNKYAGITKRIAIIDEGIPASDGKREEKSISLSAFDYICTDDCEEYALLKKAQ